MTLTTSTITGRVPLPSDLAPKYAEVVFTLTKLDTEGDQVIPGGASSRFVLDANGDMPAGATLWRNTEGLRATAYRMVFNWDEFDRTRGTVRRTHDAGLVQVGDLASYTIAQLINSTPVPVPENVYWSTITQAEYDAAIAAVLEAQGSAASAASDADRAELAAEQAIAAGAWDYTPNDAAALAAITGMTTGETALVRDTMHVWEYDGSAWVDTGESPLASKMDTDDAQNLFLIGSGPTPSSQVSLGRSYFNGTTASGTYGASIPANLVGDAVIFQPIMSPVYEVGRTYKFVITFTMSNAALYFLQSFRVFVGGASVDRSSSAVMTYANVGGTTWQASFEYTIVGDETDIRPFVFVRSNGVAVATSAEYVDVRTYDLTVGVISPNEAAVDEKISNSVDGLIAGPIALRDISDGDRRKVGSFSRSYYSTSAPYGDFGITVPIALVGNAAIIQPKIVNDFEAGDEVRFVMSFHLSDPSYMTINNPSFRVYVGGVYTNRTSDAVLTTRAYGNYYDVAFTYTVQGDEDSFDPFAFVRGANSPALGYVEAASVRCYVVAASDPVTPNERAVQALIENAASSPIASAERTVAYYGIPAEIPDAKVTVAPSGASHTSILTAVNSITDATAANRIAVAVAAGKYTSAEIKPTIDYVDILGSGVKETTIDFQQTDGTSTGDISAYSALYMQTTMRLQDAAVVAKNARYGVHIETGRVYRNKLMEISGCHISHLGNPSPNNTWGAVSALGVGMSGGQVVRLRNSTFLSVGGTPAFYHNWNNEPSPCFWDMEGCSLISHQSNPIAFQISVFGSGRADKCRLVGNVFGGYIDYSFAAWAPSTLSTNPANHCEVEIYGHGNTPAAFVNNDWGQALKIQSASSGASSGIVLGGDAVKWLFGNGAQDWFSTVSGSAGAEGYVEGWGDVSEADVGPSGRASLAVTPMGKRLGDCSTTNKTLTITVDGGTPINIVFNVNYNAATNATILSTINAALGSAAVASLSNPGSRYRPRFTDEEMSLRNTSGSIIRMGMVLAYDGAGRNVRPMTSADSASLFAGVAWEDIPDNAAGRVKTSGYIPVGDVLRTDSGMPAFSNTFSVGATAGSVAIGGSQGLLKAVGNNALQVS